MMLNLEKILLDNNIERKILKLKKNPTLFFKDFYMNKINSKKSQLTAQPVKKINLEEKKPSKILQRVNIGENSEVFYKRLKKILIEFDVKYMLGAAPDQWMYGIHIEKNDLHFFLRVIMEWLNSSNIFIKVRNESYSVAEFFKLKNKNQIRSFDILVTELDSVDTKYCSYIHVMLWQKIDSYSSEVIYSILEENKYIHRLREDRYYDLMTNHLEINDKNHIEDINFPIDVVYTWVDGEDLLWKAEKIKYQGGSIENIEEAARAYSDERFRNRDELLYSLRSIELFAPFVRNIYIVTAGQTPEWLNLSHPKIHIVDHKDIYRNIEHLPTFNSSGIETQLHHIEGLSEYFLYLNDDFMLGDFCTPSDFFYANGIIKFFPSEARAYEDDIDDSREEYLIADRNAINLMKKDYDVCSRYIMKHAPYPCNKSYLYELERRYSSQFADCASSRFRSKKDLRPIAFMQPNLGLIEGKAIASNISNRYLALYKNTIKEQFDGVINSRKYKTICINDVGVSIDNLEETNKLTHDFLENYYTIKSSFEV